LGRKAFITNKYYSDDFEIEYTNTTDAKCRRALGQFFTPFEVAAFMSEWLLSGPGNDLNILDPAAGFGIFERAIHLQNNEMGKKLSFDLWEIDEKIAEALTLIIQDMGITGDLVVGDFLSGEWSVRYDGIIANPPYSKHHHIEDKSKVYQDIRVHTFFKFSIQTNIYCWFLVKALNLLADGGRLAFIIPSEFQNANYGEKVKSYLLETGLIRSLINVDFRESVFDSALTTSIIVLAEKSEEKFDSIDFYNLKSVSDLSTLSDFLSRYPKKTYQVSDLDPAVKWRNYFIGTTKTHANSKLVPFSKYGRFKRGIATGANNYFTLTDEEAVAYKLPEECLIPCITKASYARDMVFTSGDFDELVETGKRVYLFDGERSSVPPVVEYIQRGEREGISARFLTRHRSPWYELEKRGISKIWVSVFGRKRLKFVWNESDCINLTCFHAFYPTGEGEKFFRILFLFLNTRFASELLDKEKREYGNGLEKYEPNDINKSLVVDFNCLPDDELEELDQMQAELFEGNEAQAPRILETADTLFRTVL